MSLELKTVERVSSESNVQEYTSEVLCEMANNVASDSGERLTSLDRFEMMKAIADGGLLLRSGRLIKLEDRTNPNRFVA